jgi:pyruvate dehydrogenase E1 component beta subunit
MAGLRPVVEIQFDDFMACAMDQICNQAAKMHFMSGGQAKMPIVFRAPVGATGRAAQHSQSLEAWFMHTPGLKVVMPSTPYDAKGLIKTAIRDDNPVIFLEHKLLYGAKLPRVKPGVVSEITNETAELFREIPEEDYTIDFGVADIKCSGKDVTVVATSLMVHKAIKAAGQLAKEGIDVEVIDPRTLVPLDKKTILESVQKTSRLVVVSESQLTCGMCSEIAAIVADEGWSSLKAPIKRVAVPDTPVPFAPIMEKSVIPNEQGIIEAVKSVLV